MWQLNLFLITVGGAISCVACLYFYLRARRNISSFSLSLFLFVVFSLIMVLVDPIIYSATGDIHLDRFIWYATFALFDVLAILSINLAHKYYQINLHRDSLVIVIFFLLSMLLQVSRYIDRDIIETNVLGGFYASSLQFLNASVWLYLIFVTVFHVLRAKQIKELK
jgi:hypothetical protein